MSIAATHWLPWVTQWSYTFVRSNWVFWSTPSPQAGPVWTIRCNVATARVSFSAGAESFCHQQGRWVEVSWVGWRAVCVVIHNWWSLLDLCLSGMSGREDMSGRMEAQNVSVQGFLWLYSILHLIWILFSRYNFRHHLLLSIVPPRNWISHTGSVAQFLNNILVIVGFVTQFIWIKPALQHVQIIFCWIQE